MIAYTEDPRNHIDADKLEIHGGHAWQRGKLDRLSAGDVYDMRELIRRIGRGTAQTEPMAAQIPFLDTNFKYATATITWNKATAAKYAEAVRAR